MCYSGIFFLPFLTKALHSSDKSVLSNTIVITHVWLCKIKFKSDKIKNSVPLLHELHFKSSIATFNQWLLYWTLTTVHQRRVFYCIALSYTCSSVTLYKSSCKFWYKPFPPCRNVLFFCPSCQIYITESHTSPKCRLHFTCSLYFIGAQYIFLNNKI